MPNLSLSIYIYVYIYTRARARTHTHTHIHTYIHTYMTTLFSLAHTELLSRYSAPCNIDVAILVSEDALPIQRSF